MLWGVVFFFFCGKNEVLFSFKINSGPLNAFLMSDFEDLQDCYINFIAIGNVT